MRAENLEAAAKGVQSKAEADPFSRYNSLFLFYWVCICFITKCSWNSVPVAHVVFSFFCSFSKQFPFLIPSLTFPTLLFSAFRRETRPKILWNTGKRLEDARLPEGTAPSAAAE